MLPHTISKARKRKGFTLGEVLTTIAIVATLAAVVIPAVAGQIQKGDIGRVSNDLLNTRTGMEQFLADVRRYAKSMGQLTNSGALTGSWLSGVSYTTAEQTRWRGPYINKDSSAAVATGFGVTFGVSGTAGLFSVQSFGTTGVAGT